jgi:hypothetical protein
MYRENVNGEPNRQLKAAEPHKGDEEAATEALNARLHRQRDHQNNRRGSDRAGRHGVACRAGNCIAIGPISAEAVEARPDVSSGNFARRAVYLAGPFT